MHRLRARLAELMVHHPVLEALVNPFRDLPPMPTAVRLAATLRETGLTDQRGEHGELAVARVDFIDVMGDQRTMDFTPELAMDLLRQLANFVTQVGVQGRP